MSYINGEKVALSSNLNIIGGNRDKFRKFIDGSITKLTAEDLNEVSSIGDYAFMWYENLTSITIPSNITRIGDYAFSECRNLISVIIEEGVTYIGDYVFSGVVNSNQIKSITYPSTVTEIGIMNHASIESMTVLAKTPPICESVYLPSGATIYIPAGTLEVYKRASGWSEYSDYLVELSE